MSLVIIWMKEISLQKMIFNKAIILLLLKVDGFPTLLEIILLVILFFFFLNICVYFLQVLIANLVLAYNKFLDKMIMQLKFKNIFLKAMLLKWVNFYSLNMDKEIFIDFKLLDFTIII